LLPGPSIALYGTEPEPHLMLIMRFFGSTLLAFGVLVWFGKNFRDWEAVRGVLIAVIILNVVGLLVTVLGMAEGLLNSTAWSSLILYAVFLVGAVYCLSAGARKLA
jgi:chromate transport protein ChrA